MNEGEREEMIIFEPRILKIYDKNDVFTQSFGYKP